MSDYIFKKTKNLFSFFFKKRTIVLSSGAKTRYINLNPFFQFSILLIFSCFSLSVYTSFLQFLKEKNLINLKKENEKLRKVNDKLNYRFRKVREDIDKINEYIEFDKKNIIKNISFAEKINNEESVEKLEKSFKFVLSSLYSKIDQIDKESKVALNILGINGSKRSFQITKEILDENAVGGPFEKYKEENNKLSFVERIKNKKDVSDYLSNKIKNIITDKKKLNISPIADPSGRNEKYIITGSFGKRKDPFTGELAIHGGIDLFVNNRKIKSTTEGIVLRAGKCGTYGNLVEIRNRNDENEVIVRFAHLNKVLVKVGDIVSIGQKIGIQGSTGRSKAEHVHYEVILNGVKMNPYNFLTFKKRYNKERV